jgi:hypothetical protein
VTFDKGFLRKIAINSIFTWVHAGYLQAVELNKPDLAKALDKDPAWLYKCSENVFIGKTTTINLNESHRISKHSVKLECD